MFDPMPPNRRLRVTRYLLIALLALPACGDGSDAGGPPFDGETVELIVPFREGGGSDTYARAVAPFLQKHLEGDARVRVMNVLGASGIQGGNEFALRRDPDGLSLLITSGSNSLPFILGESAVRYDFATFAGVLGSPTGGVVYASPSTGVTDLASLCDAGGLIYGGISPTGLDMVPLISFELLGLEVQTILGYQGKGAARVAFEQGETTLDYQTTPAYQANVTQLVEMGDAIPLYTFGQVDAEGRVVRDPVFPEIPSAAEAYEACSGTAPEGPAWEAYRAVLIAGFSAQKAIWAHAEAPPERLGALRQAAIATVADPEFQALTDDLLGGYEFYTGDTVTVAFERASQINPEARSWLLSLLRDRYDVALP